jgi:uridine phosphorylase
MIRFSKGDGVIPPKGIRSHETNKGITYKVPEVAVGIFSCDLFERILEKFPELNPRDIGYICTANQRRSVYIINYKGTEIVYFIAGVGGPVLSGDMENLAQSGVKKFIILGNCGVLDKKIKDCAIIIPTLSYREDGTSQHYVPDSETIVVNPNPEYIKAFEEVLDENHISHIKAPTWTTDAYFRETDEKVAYFKSKGVKTVEMEAATIAAFCQLRKLEHFTFYYAADNLDSEKWEERSLNGKSNLEQKEPVPFLAFDLAVKLRQYV